MISFFKNKSLYPFYYLCIILLFFNCFSPLDAIAIQSYKEEKPDFTDTEKKFIKNNPTITIAMMDEWYPISFKDNGHLKGLSVDILRIIENKTGLSLNFIPDIWANGLIKFKTGKVDMIDGISFKPERTAFTLFTKPYYELPTVIMGRHDFGLYSGLKSLKGKKAAVINNIFFLSELKEINGIDIIEYDTTREQIRDLAFGKVDVVINNYSNCQKIISQSGYTGLTVLDELNINGVGREDLRFGIRKDRPVLQSIINKGLDAISREDFLSLENKWIGAYKSSQFGGASRIDLTNKEKAFLKAHPAIRVSNQMDWPPFDFTVGNQPQGYMIDILNLLADRIGIQLEFINGYNWNQLKGKFKKKELDILHTPYEKPIPNDPYLVSSAIYKIQKHFITTKDKPEITDIKKLYGKIVAVVKGRTTEIELADHHPKIKLLVVLNTEDAFKSVTDGVAYATVETKQVASYLIKKRFLQNLKISSRFKDSARPNTDKLHFLLQKNMPELKSMIDKALASLTPGELEVLDKKWFTQTGSQHSDIMNKIVFTSEERKYLNQKKTIKYCIDPQWAPFEFLDKQGKHQGITREIFTLFRELSGINFEIVPTDSWNQTMDYAKSRQCDIISQAAATTSRLDYLDFTSTFLDYPQVIATDKSKPFINEIEDILDKRIGAVEGYAIIEILKAKYPDIKIITYKNLNEGLFAVTNNQIYGFVDFFPGIAYELQHGAFSNLKISGKINEKIGLSIATRNDEPVLHTIMEKLLQKIPSDKYRQSFNKWISVKYDQGFDYKLFWKIILGIIISLIIIFYRYYIISKYNRKLTEMNLTLEELSKTDRLTSLANRHHLDDILTKEISRVNRYNTFFSVIIGDVDYFKLVNDTFGHNTGDKVLKTIASIMNLYTRQSELIGRWGGEEFLIICPESDLNGTMQLAEKLRRAIENHEFNFGQTVTMSFGVASHLKNENAEAVIAKADKALYRAKRAGRNRVAEYIDP